MNPRTQHTHIAGPVGQLQIQIDEAEQSVPFKGVAITAHPNPVQGGTMDNKVVQTIAKAFVAMGWRSIRFNYRGVGTSAGEFANGIGESDDLLAVIQAYAPSGSLSLAGFSFGTFCATHALQTLAASGRDLDADIGRIALIGSAAGKFALAPLAPELHNRTLTLHAEADDVIALSAVMDWARPQSLPVTVVPAGSHFFHGQLPLLKHLILRHLA